MSTRGIQTAIGEWTMGNLRDLPWRRTRDPWTVLVSETMLQQTQVSRVIDRLPRFLDRFPSPEACSRASAADLIREWSGLGYNRRALMLHRCATAIRDHHGGEVPRTLAELLALPGVGPYTARAVRAFAFELPAAPVDTNIGRVLARLGGETLTPKQAQAWADQLVPSGDVWLWNQGIMELGALICTKRSPGCGRCPVARYCRWQGSGGDPAVRSAAVSKPQSKFEGSDRQLRGRLIDALRVGPIPVTAVGSRIECVDAERTERVVEGLCRDALIERDGLVLQLAGDAERSPGPVSD